MAALAQAHARAHRRWPWNAAQSSHWIDTILQTFSVAPVPAPDALGSQVIFIASLPLQARP